MGLYVVGIAALAAGVLVGGIVAAATGSAAGLTVASIIAGAGIATGGLSLWESRRFDRRARRLQQTIAEQRLLTLAQEQGGILRVVDAARALRLGSEEAEALLDGLVDEVRVCMRVTDEGEIHYVFRELPEGGGPRVRIAPAEPETVEADPAEADARRTRTIE